MGSTLLHHRALLPAFVLGMAVVQPALLAQAPDPSHELRLFESTERDEDPLSLDQETGTELDRAAASLPKAAPPPPPSPRVGEVLAAIDGVQEDAHQVGVALDDGLARVETRLTFSSRATHAAEVAYRLPLPAGAVVTRVARCVAGRCEEALPGAHDESGARAVFAETIVDARGLALALRISPIVKGARVEARVTYVAPAPLRGGQVRFMLPARGHDPRSAEAEVRVNAPGLTEVAPATSLRIDASRPLALVAKLRDAAAGTRKTAAACGAETCTRTYAARALATPVTRPTQLWIDASPSMEGPPRGRASAVIGALLALLPEGTPLRAYAFAARAESLGAFDVDAAPAALLADATLRSLDAASRLSSVVALSASARLRERPRVLIVSDGRLDASPSERSALAALRRAGAEPWLLHVGDAQPALADGLEVLDVASLADAAARDGLLEPLVDALRATVMPRHDGVRAGEERVTELRPRRFVPGPGASWLTHWLARSPRPRSFVLGAAPARDVVAAIPFVAALPPAAPPDTGMPKESVLAMLRTQLVPAARACLRTDRRGRADYAVGLTFHALFAAREVAEARVEGALPPALRACLEEVLPRLRVPAFSGRIRVHYPVHTEREAEPPRIELEPDLERELSRAFEPEPSSL